MIRKRLVYLFVLIALLSFHISCFAFDDSELDKLGITDEEQIKELRSAVISILTTQSAFAVMSIKRSCKEDISEYCGDEGETLGIVACIKRNQRQVSRTCKKTLLKEFGGEPLTEAQTYNGVLLPVGSRLGYNPDGKIISALVPEEFEYRGIYFKAGNIWFHGKGKGISSAALLGDQMIDGIMCKSGRMNVFFDEKGNINNSILAEDTTINGIKYKEDTQVMLYGYNRVKFGTIAEDTEINGEYFPAESVIWFNKNGSLDKRFGSKRN
jgi:hypothetical protein